VDGMPLGHLGLNVVSLPKAKAFYDALMPLVEFEPFLSSDTEFAYRPAGGKIGTYLFFYAASDEGAYSRHAPGLQHLAFMVRTRTAVRETFDVVRGLGATVILPPQEFPQYHPGYYAAFVRDLDGFMVEFVCHRDAE
jgi:catechol 2,3-dioxygenase-like lactoylglutathione lyase family enzyme